MLRLVYALVVGLLLTGPAAAVPLGEDGLHKPDWFVETFRDLRDDLADANADGKRLLLMFEQRGCIYCTKMHEEVYVDPEIERLLSEEFWSCR